MLTFKAKLKEYMRTLDKQLILMLDTKEEMPEDELIKLLNTDKGIKVQMSVWREPRSINANNYAWVLMDEIAKKTRSTKELVYRNIIARVGVFEILPIKNEAVNNFIGKWESRGLGWVCEVMRDSKIQGYTNVIAYYGSSVYNTKEMSRLIDEIVHDAQELGIQTKTPQEIAELKSLWEQYEVNNTGK